MTTTDGKRALTATDDGRVLVPGSDEDWLVWVAASRTRSYLLEDPLLDWLALYGEERGFVPDDKREGYDPRTSFTDFIFEKGDRFEAGVVALLRERAQVVEIGADYRQSRELAAAEATVDAMAGGVEIIVQGVLRDPEHRSYGMADLLVRSDVLARLFPDAIPLDEAGTGAPGLGLRDRHYRVIDIKFKTLELLRDVTLSGAAGALPFQAQVWIYNAAIGRIQGYTPPVAYLLGRNWKRSNGDRGDGCLDQLGVVPMERRFRGREDASLEELTLAALEWVRAVRLQGSAWQVLPEPSRPELYPHMRQSHDEPWHGAKGEIAAELQELTLVPRMNPGLRREAHRKGMKRWSDPAVTAASLGITGPTYSQQCDAVLAANRAGMDVVLPERIVVTDQSWRDRARLELYVDFETVSSLDDDFSNLPAAGGQALIFQIGCGRWRDGEWLFDQWTVDRLDEPSETAMVDAFVGRLLELAAEAGTTLDETRIYHWSPAETSNLDSAYNSARNRHPEKPWPDLPWYDLLVKVVREAPLTVTGAFDFGLKAIAKNMQRMGLIETAWGEGPTDGMGAMIAAWHVEHEIAETGGVLLDHELMQEVAAYNEVDCKVMAEILRWLRAREDGG